MDDIASFITEEQAINNAANVAQLADDELTVVIFQHIDKKSGPEIGEILGVTRQRVCQIANAARTKLDAAGFEFVLKLQRKG